jgi:hypothetical protein
MRVVLLRVALPLRYNAELVPSRDMNTGVSV